MSSFDPYQNWLGIPPHEQPPNLYRLLGLVLLEGNPEVIVQAADRQMAHVMSFQSGRFAELCQPLLNELGSARDCLLDPQQKANYDAQLQQSLAFRSERVVTAVPPPPGGYPAVDFGGGPTAGAGPMATDANGGLPAGVALMPPPGAPPQMPMFGPTPGQMPGPMPGPMQGPMQGPMPGSMSGPMPDPMPGPMLGSQFGPGPMAGFAQAPGFGPAPGFGQSPMPASASYPMPGQFAAAGPMPLAESMPLAAPPEPQTEPDRFVRSYFKRKRTQKKNYNKEMVTAGIILGAVALLFFVWLIANSLDTEGHGWNEFKDAGSTPHKLPFIPDGGKKNAGVKGKPADGRGKHAGGPALGPLGPIDGVARPGRRTRSGGSAGDDSPLAPPLDNRFQPDRTAPDVNSPPPLRQSDKDPVRDDAIGMPDIPRG
jgi:hypothetical protein